MTGLPINAGDQACYELTVERMLGLLLPERFDAHELEVLEMALARSEEAEDTFDYDQRQIIRDLGVVIGEARCVRGTRDAQDANPEPRVERELR